MAVVTSNACHAKSAALTLSLLLPLLAMTAIRSKILGASSVHTSMECNRDVDGEAGRSTYLSRWMMKVTIQATSATTIMIASASWRWRIAG